MTRPPSRRPSATPSAPNRTASTSGVSDTQTTTTSAARAASPALAATLPPSPARSSPRPSLRFQPVTSKPARRRFAAIAAPIVPSPTNAIRSTRVPPPCRRVSVPASGAAYHRDRGLAGDRAAPPGHRDARVRARGPRHRRDRGRRPDRGRLRGQEPRRSPRRRPGAAGRGPGPPVGLDVVARRHRRPRRGHARDVQHDAHRRGGRPRHRGEQRPVARRFAQRLDPRQPAVRGRLGEPRRAGDDPDELPRPGRGARGEHRPERGGHRRHGRPDPSPAGGRRRAVGARRRPRPGGQRGGPGAGRHRPGRVADGLDREPSRRSWRGPAGGSVGCPWLRRRRDRPGPRHRPRGRRRQPVRGRAAKAVRAPGGRPDPAADPALPARRLAGPARRGGAPPLDRRDPGAHRGRGAGRSRRGRRGRGDPQREHPERPRGARCRRRRHRPRPRRGPPAAAAGRDPSLDRADRVGPRRGHGHRDPQRRHAGDRRRRGRRRDPRPRPLPARPDAADVPSRRPRAGLCGGRGRGRPRQHRRLQPGAPVRARGPDARAWPATSST